jgi:histidyl-tRNA synthetase
MPTPRGTRDFLPDQMRKRRFIFDTVRSVFLKYGFGELETPAFELWETMREKGGAEIEKEIYVFKDKGDRDMALRFDLTVPLARVVAENPNLPKPFKRLAVGRVWRYERPTSDRWREFWQADVDIIGSDSMECEAECLSAASECLRALGFKEFKIILNNRKLLNAIMKKAGIASEKTVETIRSLDKLLKIGEEGVLKELSEKGTSEKQGKKLLSLVSTSGKPAKIFTSLGKELGEEEGLKELQEIYQRCASYGIQDIVEINPALARGFDYYTGPIFEISAGKDIGSVAGGGRYDELIGKYGKYSEPAVGISLGIERIFEVMENKGMFKLTDSSAEVFVAIVNEDVVDNAAEIAQKLRDAGILTELELKGRKLGKQFEYADTKDIPVVIVVGPKELEENKVNVRDMSTGKEEKVAIPKLSTFVKGIKK